MRVVASIGLLACASSIALAQPKKATAEIDEVAKDLVGTWKCTGKAVTKEQTSAPYTLRLKVERTLDGQWLHSSSVVTSGDQHGSNQAFTGYVVAEGTYYRYTVSSDGSYMTQTASMDRAMGGTWGLQWVGEARGVTSSKMHSFQTRNVEKFSAGTFERSSEVSVDGKSWTKLLEMTCKK